MRFVGITKSTPPSKSSDKMARELFEQSEKEFVGERRPNISIGPEKVEAVQKAVELARGNLVLELRKVVEWLEVSPSFADPGRAAVFAGSLTRRLASVGITVGARANGQYLTFRRRSKKTTP